MNQPLNPNKKELIYSIVFNLESLMVLQRPTLDYLSNWLKERFSSLKTNRDKSELLKKILELEISRNIDVYYLETIRPFFIDIEDKLSFLDLDKDRKQQRKNFEDLFTKKENAKEVKRVLDTMGYTKNGKWEGLTNDKSELLCVYYVLKPLLKPHKITPIVRLFYIEFGLSEDYITDRHKTIEPFNENRKELEKVFAHLLQSKHQ